MLANIHTGRQNRGAALVEMVIVLPLLLLVVFGMIDFGLLIKDRVALNQAAREGARAASIGKTPAEIRQIVVTSSPTLAIANNSTNIALTTNNASALAAQAKTPDPNPDSWNTQLGVNGAVNNAASSDLILVKVTTTHNRITSLFFGSSSFTVFGKCVMRRE
jgi:Flp pilus assembly protein TadG